MLLCLADITQTVETVVHSCTVTMTRTRCTDWRTIAIWALSGVYGDNDQDALHGWEDNCEEGSQRGLMAAVPALY